LNIIDLFLYTVATFSEHCSIALVIGHVSTVSTCDRELHLPTLTHFPLDWCDTTVDCKLPWSPQGGWVPPGSRGWPWHTDNSEGNWVQYWSSYFECHKFEL